MGQLRDEMLKVMELRNLSPNTITSYLNYMTTFTRFINKSPAETNAQEIRDYLYYLLKERNLSWSSINVEYSAIQFFWEKVLHRPWNVAHIPRSKTDKPLPIILSRTDISKLFHVTTNLKHRMILMTIYSGGLRVSEAANLKIANIESDRMLIRVNQGKGKKDRFTLLSSMLVPELRDYYLTYRPISWLFPGKDASKPISKETIQRFFKRSKRNAGILKEATPHTLRHSFATHYLEDGGNVFTLKELLGHSNLQTTLIYIHMQFTNRNYMVSPLDNLSGGPVNE
jgi:site-specific recombinase XerD